MLAKIGLQIYGWTELRTVGFVHNSSTGLRLRWGVGGRRRRTRQINIFTADDGVLGVVDFGTVGKVVRECRGCEGDGLDDYIVPNCRVAAVVEEGSEVEHTLLNPVGALKIRLNHS